MASPSDNGQGDCPSCRHRDESPPHSPENPAQGSSSGHAPPSRTDSPSATFYLDELLNQLSLSNPIHHDIIKGSEIYRIAQQVDARLTSGMEQTTAEKPEGEETGSDDWRSDRSSPSLAASPRAGSGNLAPSVGGAHGRAIKKLPSRTLSPSTASVSLPDNVSRGVPEGLPLFPSTPTADQDDASSSRSEGIDSAGTASGTTDETTWKSPLVTTGSTTPDMAQKEVMQASVPPSNTSSRPLKFDLPAPRHSSSSALLDSCNILMPYWPKDAFSQELALLNVGGFTGAEILSEITEEAAAAVQDSRFVRRGGSSERHVAGGDDRHHHHHDHYDHDDVHQITTIDRFGGTTGWLEPSSNNKKRKSRRSEVDDIGSGGGQSGGGHTIVNSRRFNASVAASGRHGAIPEGSSTEDEAQVDDEVERPDVSSSTFRASRLVDDMDEEEQEQQHQHQHGHRRGQASASSPHRLEHPLVRPAWSSAFRRELRSDIKLRLSIKRARDAWCKKMKMKQEQDAAEQHDQGRGRKGEKGTARDTTSADGSASTAPPAPPPKPRKASKAEKRAQALRNKGGGGGTGQKKLTLADIRARAAGATSSTSTASGKPEPGRATTVKEEQNDADEEAQQPASSPAPPSPPSPPALAPASPALPISGTFEFTCPSRITDVLTVARASVRSLLDESFDKVISRLDLPKIIDERWPSIGPTVWKSKTPMLWPGAEVPTRKYLPGTVSRTRGNEKKWVTRGETDAAQKLVFEGVVSVRDSVNTIDSPPKTNPNPKPASAPKLSRRKKATMNNIHHISNYSPARAPSTVASASNEDHPASSPPPPAAGAPTTTSTSTGPSSYLFSGTDYICMFCEYELFYGEPPLFFRACSHRRRRVKEERRRRLRRSAKEGGGSGKGGAAANEGGAKVGCTCESCGHHQQQDAGA